jgi:hypothetical protein
MNKKLTSEQKQSELKRHRDILLATLDYFIDRYQAVKYDQFDPVAHFQQLKLQTEECYQKGQLATLKQWLRDMTVEPRETKDKFFNDYIRSKTGHDYDVFNDFENRISKIIKRKKIKSEDEHRDVMSLIDKLCQTDPVDNVQIDMQNNLISDFENEFDKKAKDSKISNQKNR